MTIFGTSAFQMNIFSYYKMELSNTSEDDDIFLKLRIPINSLEFIK